MYQHLVTPFGKWEKHSLVSPDGKNRLDLVPGHGACVLDLVFDGISILDGYQTPEELDAMHWSKNIVLYPFPNRLRDGRYRWQGAGYQFPINDQRTGNALHGFGAAKPMEVSNLVLRAEEASISCKYSGTGDDPAYPFPFSFSIEFTLGHPYRFTAAMKFENQGKEVIPAGLGWHPYFQLSEPVDRLRLQFPPVELVAIDERMIPTGSRQEYDHFAELKPIGNTSLDNCFALPGEEAEAIALIKGNSGTIRYWQETGKGKFNYLQVFTPPHRSSIALEPMTCNVDAFNNGDGLIALEPQEQATGKFGLTFHPGRVR